MARLDQIRASLQRSQHRRKYCERQLSDFVETADLSDPNQERCWRRLSSDLERVESDIGWLQRHLDDLMD